MFKRYFDKFKMNLSCETFVNLIIFIHFYIAYKHFVIRNYSSISCSSKYNLWFFKQLIIYISKYMTVLRLYRYVLSLYYIFNKYYIINIIQTIVFHFNMFVMKHNSQFIKELHLFIAVSPMEEQTSASCFI